MAHAEEQRCRWRALHDRLALDDAVAGGVLAAAERAISARGLFHLPWDDSERNSRMAGESWLDHVSIPGKGLHAIPADLGAARAALAYAATLHERGEFELVLLGLGEDGHTASLFPAHDRGSAPDSPDALAVFDAPKPPPQRVTPSAARLSRARQVMFLVSGEGKRAAVAAWRAGENIPARSIAPTAGLDVLVESALLVGRAG